jgi:perosamine synthetase
MIPVCEPVIGAREHEYVSECLRSGWVSSAGEYIERFEEAWADRCGMAHGIAVSNGTTALQLAVADLELEAGDEVILPTFTIISCALAVLRCHGVPILVDSDPATWCMDVDAVSDVIGPRTRAIMAVHIYGHPVDMDPLRDLADSHGLALIEDAAEAHGAQYRSGRDSEDAAWATCGGLGDVSTFSFYANKLVTTGEGGMVLTDDARASDRLRALRNLCFGHKQRFRHEKAGYNYRLTNVQAAMGLAQVERFDEIVAAKRRIGLAYVERLRDNPHIELQLEAPWAQSVFWMNGFVLAESAGMDADEMSSRLLAESIQTRPFFLGMHEQPVFRDLGLFDEQRFPVAQRLSRSGLYLPSGIGLTEAQIDYICATVQGILP